MDRDAGKVNITVLYITVPYTFLHYSTVLYCTASVLQGGIFTNSVKYPPLYHCTVQVICTVLYCIPQGMGYCTQLDHQILHMDRDAAKVNITLLYSTVL